MTQRVYQIVAVGDGLVGKTCLLHSFTENTFLMDYVPTIYEKQEFDITLDGQNRTIRLYDTAGQEEYDRLRQTIYKHADCFLVCYAINDRNSFENVKSQWLPEIGADLRNNPVVLCGTKQDLRGTTAGCISTSQGEDLAQQIGAYRFVECSAKDNRNVSLVIHEAVRAAVLGPQTPTAIAPLPASAATVNKEETSACCCSIM